MHISDLEMYDLLKERMSEKEAREFVAYIETKVEGTFIDAKNILDQDYTEVYGYNTLRFNINTGISFKL